MTGSMCQSISAGFVLIIILSKLVTVIWSQDITIYPPVHQNDTNCHLYFGLIVSFGEEINTSSNVAGVRLALNKINSNRYLLQNYTLHYVLSDSQCDRTVALNAFFEQVTTPPTKLALIGAGCSTATEPTAEISYFFNISQLSCSSESPVLTNRKRFPKYFQLLPSSSELANAYNGILEEFGWRHVAFIVQDEDLFTIQVEKAKNLFDQRSVTYTVYTFSTEKGISSLDEKPFSSQNPRERIFIIATHERHALDLLCEAYKEGIQYPTHVLITYQWYSPWWWLKKEYNTSCNSTQREQVLHHSLAVAYLETRLANDTAVYINSTEFINEIDKETFGYQASTPYCYDATWTLARALKRTFNRINQTGGESGSPTRDCNKIPINHSILDTVFQELNDSDLFVGISGDVAFDDNGIRKATRLPVYQFRYKSDGINPVQFAVFIRNETLKNNYSFLYYGAENIDSVWTDGIPYDGVVQPMVTTLHPPVTIIFSILATSGIIFSSICLIFNIIYRNKKVVRLTSPKLNYFIVAGAILFYIDIYFFVLPTYTEQSVRLTCNAETWLTVTAYTFCFGTIMAKMCRVWIIFRKPKPNKRMAINDWVLAAGVLALFALDLIILTIYTALEQTLGGTLTKLIPNVEIAEEQGESESKEYLAYFCDSKVHDVVSGFFYGFKGILQVVALLLAFMTRKVKVKGLDDAKYIAAIIYITSIVIAVITVSEYSISQYINAYAVVFSTGILAAPTCVLILVFVPTMIRLYKDPKGENVFDAHRSTGTSVTPGDLHGIHTLKTRVKELENKLSTMGIENEYKTSSTSQSNHTTTQSVVNTDNVW